VSLVLVDFTAVDGEAEALEQLSSLLILRLTAAEQVEIQRRTLRDDDPSCTRINNISRYNTAAFHASDVNLYS